MNCKKCGAEISNNAKFCTECGNKVEIEENKYCDKCGAILPEGAKFCLNCGTKVITSVICPKCGMELPKGALFCKECGTKLSENLEECNDSSNDSETAEEKNLSLVVDCNGSGDFRNIGQAIESASDGSKIIIKGGIYNENFNIDKVVELIGDENNIPEIYFRGAVGCKITADISVEFINFHGEDNYNKDEAKALFEITSNAKFTNCKFSNFCEGVSISGFHKEPSFINCEFSKFATCFNINKNNELSISNSSLENSFRIMELFDDSLIHINDCKLINSRFGIIIQNNAGGFIKDCKFNDIKNCFSVDDGDTPDDKSSSGKLDISDCNFYISKTGVDFNDIFYVPSNVISISRNGYSVSVKDCNIDNYEVVLSSIAAVNCYMENCTANDCNEGIYLSDDSIIDLKYCKFYGNKGSECKKGLYVAGSSKLKAINCTISSFDVGVYIYEASADLDNCDILDNLTFGIDVSSCSCLRVNGCNVENNKERGIVFSGDLGPSTISNCDFKNNGIGVDFLIGKLIGQGKMLVSNCNFYSNGYNYSGDRKKFKFKHCIV